MVPPSDFNIHNRVGSRSRLSHGQSNPKRQAQASCAISSARSERPALMKDRSVRVDSRAGRAALSPNKSTRKYGAYCRTRPSTSSASSIFTKVNQKNQEKEAAKNQLSKTIKLIDDMFTHRNFSTADTLAKSADVTVKNIVSGRIDSNKPKLALSSLCCKHLNRMKNLDSITPSENASKVSSSLKKMLFESVNSIYNQVNDGDLSAEANIGSQKKLSELSGTLSQASKLIREVVSEPPPKSSKKSTELFNKNEKSYLDMMSKGLDRLAVKVGEKADS